MKASRRELQRLVGRLRHIAKCVEPTRHFMSRIFAALRDTAYVGKHNIPDGFRNDIKWFLEFATRSNGKVLIKGDERRIWLIECDSSVNAGGTFSPTHYYSKCYDRDTRHNYANIAHLKAINLVTTLPHPNLENTRS